jgi:hypothetical protein
MGWSPAAASSASSVSPPPLAIWATTSVARTRLGDRRRGGGGLRALARGGRFAAVLDTARIAPGPGGALLDALLDVAEERALRRGCRQVRAWLRPDDGQLRAALASRGWSVDESLTGALAPRG